MAIDPTKVHRSGGRLVLNPTAIGAAYPHGGTVLGLIDAVRLEPITRGDPIEAEEYGGEEVEDVFLGRQWTLEALLRQWDQPALALLFPGVFVGGSGQPVVREPDSSFKPGAHNSSRAQTVLFSPYDADTPGWIMYEAVPLVDRTVKLNTRIVSELTIGIVLKGYRDGADQIIDLGLRGDL